MVSNKHRAFGTKLMNLEREAERREGEETGENEVKDTCSLEGGFESD